jgi:glutamine amidotransferase
VTKPRVVVLDYGSGNVHSAVKALVAAGAEVELTNNRELVLAADGLVVPGVGAFASVMHQLNAIGGAKLIDQRLAAGKKVLGICVGLQVLFDAGFEHGVETPGLGQLPGEVESLDAPQLPHIGWNTVDAAQGSVLFAGVENERFYFVHSYGVRHWKLEAMGAFLPPKVSWAEYGSAFVAAFEVGPLSATQFHPEKSGKAGIRLLTNWVNSLK